MPPKTKTASANTPKRHQRPEVSVKDTKTKGINNATIHKQAKRGGCVRIETDVYDVVREILTTLLADIVTSSVKMVRLNNRQTVRLEDALQACKMHKITLLGLTHAKK